MREFLFARVPRDEREETGGAAVVFWTQNSSESLCFFLAGAERAGNLNENVGFGQVDGEIPHFGQHNTAQRAAAEAIVDSLTFRLRRLSGNQRDAEFPGNGLDLGEVFADDQDTRARMAFEKLTQAHHFRWVFSSDAELRPSVRQCIFHPPLGTHRHALLDTGGAGNPGLPFQVFPGNIETLRPDESEDVRLAFIFSREGRGETETAARLKIGCRAEDRSG